MLSVVGRAPSHPEVLKGLRAGAGEVYGARGTDLRRVITSRIIFLPFAPIPAPKNVPAFMPKLMESLPATQFATYVE